MWQVSCILLGLVLGCKKFAVVTASALNSSALRRSLPGALWFLRELMAPMISSFICGPVSTLGSSSGSGISSSSSGAGLLRTSLKCFNHCFTIALGKRVEISINNNNNVNDNNNDNGNNNDNDNDNDNGNNNNNNIVFNISVALFTMEDQKCFTCLVNLTTLINIEVINSMS